MARASFEERKGLTDIDVSSKLLRDLVHARLPLKRVWKSSYYHTEVKQCRMEPQDSGFLTAVLCRSAGEDAADLAYQSVLHPESARLIEEAAHLPCHVAEACGCPEDDGVIFRKLTNIANRNMGEYLLGFDGSHLLQDFLREGFSNTSDYYFRAFHLTSAFCDSIGHLMDMTVKGMEQYKYLHLFTFSYYLGRSLRSIRRNIQWD